MLGILLNDSSYEQDIRELLMAFYPGEGFVHERSEEAAFYVEGTYLPETEAHCGSTRGSAPEEVCGEKPENGEATEFARFRLRILENGDAKTGPENAGPADTVSGERVFAIDYKNRLAAKTAIKRELYGLLSERTKKTLPWGTLTGIRPTKITLTRLDAGQSEDEIRAFMRGQYLTSPQKIDLASRSRNIRTRGKSP